MVILILAVKNDDQGISRSAQHGSCYQKSGICWSPMCTGGFFEQARKYSRYR
jgi:hypothetical protein